jgi:predicted nucleic acid-binding Zn ribbon protein
VDISGLGFWADDLRFGVQGSLSRSSRFKVQGSGFRVQGSGFRVQDSRFRVQG